MTNPPITWTGDLDDDCTAWWCGLILRAEAMDQDEDGNGTDWWWEVSESRERQNMVFSGSNGEGVMDIGEGDFKPTGAEARAAAERAARIVVRLRDWFADQKEVSE